MRSVLFQVGPLAIRGYGLMLALSFLIGIGWAMRRARRSGMDPNRVSDLSLYLILSAILGARLFYVVFHWEEFASDPWSIINPFQEGGGIGLSGLVFYGGLILALLTSVLYTRLRGLPFWKIADLFAPSIALGLGLTRIGCFLNGCCFGKACTLPWGMVFPQDSPAGHVFPDTPIHPTQLYEMAYGLVIAGIIVGMERFKRFEGFTFALLIGLYGIARFLVDFVRYYDSMLLPVDGVQITVNQVISLGLILLSIVLFAVLGRQRQGVKGVMARPI